MGFYGNTVTVSNVHLHHKTANKFHGFGESFKRFWTRLAHLLRVHGVDILLCDLNMSLFAAVRELRSRGVGIEGQEQWQEPQWQEQPGQEQPWQEWQEQPWQG